MATQNNGKVGSTRRLRMTFKRKPKPRSECTFGESIELVARSLDMTAAEVSRWREKAAYAAFGGCEKR